MEDSRCDGFIQGVLVNNVHVPGATTGLLELWSFLCVTRSLLAASWPSSLEGCSHPDEVQV